MAMTVGGVQQQLPISNTFQPGGNAETARRGEEQRQPDSTRPLGVEPARSERTQQRAEERDERRAESSSQRGDEGRGSTSSSARGTQLDISV